MWGLFMRNRVMRALVFFDLPSVYAFDKRNYVKFRKYLQYEGFIMLQESVYSKLVLNNTQYDLLCKRIDKNAPSKGLVQLLVVTEKQYAKMRYIVGENNSNFVDSDERLIVL